MSAHKEKNGTWTSYFRYKDEILGETMQKRKRGFKTKKEALKFEIEFKNKMQGSTDMKVSTLYELYIQDVSLRIKPKTLETKKYIFETKILPYFGDLKITDVTPLMIRRFQNDFMNQVNSKTNKPYAFSYLQKTNAQLKTLISYAVRYYGLNTDPFSKVESLKSLNKDPKKEIKIWTIEEFNRFCESIKHKPMSYTAFHLLFWTGMRVGELLALTREDIDLQRKRITVNKNFSKLRGGEEVIGSTKTESSERVILIDNYLASLLERYIRMLYNPDEHDRLFPITQYLFRNDITRYHKVAGVKKIRVHDLRHSHASFLINNDVNPLIISKRLGHAKVDITLDTYAHLYPSKEEKVIDIINIANRD